MLQCESYAESKGVTWYWVLLNGIFVFGVAFNLFVCYCIVCLSPRLMSSYRWYLLWHQLVTGFTDISFNFIAKPVLFCPFQMGYTESIFRGAIPTHYMCTLCMTCSLFSLAAVQHLFVYRHLTILGRRRFPLHYKFRMFFIYSFALFCGYLYSLCFEDMATIIENDAKYYSCITKDLLDIPGFLVYDQWVIIRTVALPIILFIIIVVGESVYCITSSVRNTSTTLMSRHLIHLQRKLLIQLCCQVVVPFGFVGVPFAGHNIVVYWKIFGSGMVFGHLVIASLSSFSIVGGVVLIAMNPAYQRYFQRFRRTPVISVTPKSQLHSFAMNYY